jgi:hypothetical protein
VPAHEWRSSPTAGQPVGGSQAEADEPSTAAAAVATDAAATDTGSTSVCWVRRRRWTRRFTPSSTLVRAQWLEKQQGSAPYAWQRRWCVLQRRRESGAGELAYFKAAQKEEQVRGNWAAVPAWVAATSGSALHVGVAAVSLRGGSSTGGVQSGSWCDPGVPLEESNAKARYGARIPTRAITQCCVADGGFTLQMADGTAYRFRTPARDGSDTQSDAPPRGGGGGGGGGSLALPPEIDALRNASSSPEVDMAEWVEDVLALAPAAAMHAAAAQSARRAEQMIQSSGQDVGSGGSAGIHSAETTQMYTQMAQAEALAAYGRRLVAQDWQSSRDALGMPADAEEEDESGAPSHFVTPAASSLLDLLLTAVRADGTTASALVGRDGAGAGAGDELASSARAGEGPPAAKAEAVMATVEAWTDAIEKAVLGRLEELMDKYAMVGELDPSAASELAVEQTVVLAWLGNCAQVADNAEAQLERELARRLRHRRQTGQGLSDDAEEAEEEQLSQLGTMVPNRFYTLAKECAKAAQQLLWAPIQTMLATDDPGRQQQGLGPVCEVLLALCVGSGPGNLGLHLRGPRVSLTTLRLHRNIATQLLRQLGQAYVERLVARCREDAQAIERERCARRFPKQTVQKALGGAACGAG